MQKAILIRFGELFLKGKNKYAFEKKLLDNIRLNLTGFSFELKRTSGRYYVYDYDETMENAIMDKITHVFGIHSISPCIMLDTDVEQIKNYVSTIRLDEKTFRVSVTRADKSFPIKSFDFQPLLGGIVIDNNPSIKVDLSHPEVNVQIDIRENKKTYIFTKIILCAGGLPVGSAGKGLLLLSGGIDSPVAGYKMAQRGMELSCLHFHSYPYTSTQAREKVLELAKIMSQYTGNMKIYVCSFTKIQEAIHKNCAEEYMITIMRRIMMRIAQTLCTKNKLKTIITGESLGQVASQTIESITVTNSVVDLPVLRPLIGMDKDEIITIAQRIGTFETSILPYEDCCTVFLPKHPVIKPTIKKAEYEESKLDLDSLINEALSNIEIIEVKDI